VAVEAAAFVGGGQMREEMGGFELVAFAEFDFHWSKLHFPVAPGD
jgi:hypothetical protein